MTTGRLTAVLKNPRTTSSKLTELREENELTHEQKIMFAKHPNIDSLELYYIWTYNGNAELAAIIASRSEKLESYLLEQIVKDLKENPNNWEREEWEAIMSAFHNTIRSQSLTQYYYLLDFTYDDGPNHAWDFDDWVYENENDY